MKKFAFPLSAVALLAISSTAALAADTMGAITNIDPNTASVTLSDGYTYALAASVPLSSVQIGEQVTITYAADASTGNRTASAVTPTPGA